MLTLVVALQEFLNFISNSIDLNFPNKKKKKKVFNSKRIFNLLRAHGWGNCDYDDRKKGQSQWTEQETSFRTDSDLAIVRTIEPRRRPALSSSIGFFCVRFKQSMKSSQRTVAAQRRRTAAFSRFSFLHLANKRGSRFLQSRRVVKSFPT